MSMLLADSSGGLTTPNKSQSLTRWPNGYFGVLLIAALYWRSIPCEARTGNWALMVRRMRPRWAIPTVMRKAEELFHAGMEKNLPASLLELYRSNGAVAARPPNSAWQEQLPSGAATRDYQLVAFLAYRPESERPTVVAEIIVSKLQDDPFTIVRWHPNA